MVLVADPDGSLVRLGSEIEPEPGSDAKLVSRRVSISLLATLLAIVCKFEE